MSALFILGLVLILVFSFSLSTYVTCYEIGVQNLLTKLALISGMGIIVSAVTFVISLTIIWPPIM